MRTAAQVIGYIAVAENLLIYVSNRRGRILLFKFISDALTRSLYSPVVCVRFEFSKSALYSDSGMWIAMSEGSLRPSSFSSFTIIWIF